MTETRERIHTTICRVPGIHFNGLVRQLDVAPGQVQHHIRRLRRDGRIEREPWYGQTHYFPQGFDDDARPGIALLRRETSRAIVERLQREAPAHPDAVADALDIARSTVAFHVDRLEDAGLVEKRSAIDGGVELVLADTDRVQGLLRITDSPVHRRLADRFERLVDGLAEGRD